MLNLTYYYCSCLSVYLQIYELPGLGCIKIACPYRLTIASLPIENFRENSHFLENIDDTRDFLNVKNFL